MAVDLKHELVKQLGFKEVTEAAVIHGMHYFKGLDPNFDDNVEIKVNKQDGTVYSRVASPAGVDIDVFVQGKTDEYLPIGQLQL